MVVTTADVALLRLLYAVVTWLGIAVVILFKVEAVVWFAEPSVEVVALGRLTVVVMAKAVLWLLGSEKFCLTTTIELLVTEGTVVTLLITEAVWLLSSALVLLSEFVPLLCKFVGVVWLAGGEAGDVAFAEEVTF